MMLPLILFQLFAWTAAVEMDISSKDLVCAAAKAVADGEWNYYLGLKYGGTVGMFDGYYWWSAGEAFGGLLDYYTWCEPDNQTLHNLLFDGMYAQRGDNYDYIPSNQLMTEGNDDQGVWGMAIIEAVERNFTDPEDHLWLLMVQAIYNTMVPRWDTSHCGGGLRWQIFTWNSGYDYKNSISNGCLFHIGARLARYLGKDNNMTKNYTDTCEMVWEWMENVGFMPTSHSGGNNTDEAIYDGAKITNNCSINDTTKLRWSYTYGVFMSGCAYLWNVTEDEIWKTRAKLIMDAGLKYYVDKQGYMQETTCAPSKRCNNDQRLFRSLWLRCLHLTMHLIPETKGTIYPYIQKLAQGAANSCSGGSDGVTCGMDWSNATWDGYFGLGEQMLALEVILATLVDEVPAPFTADNGGSSKSVPDAGMNDVDYTNKNTIDIEGKDRAGAGIITAVVLLVLLGCLIWMLF